MVSLFKEQNEYVRNSKRLFERVKVKGCVNVKINRKEIIFWRGGGRMGLPILSPPLYLEESFS